jgi:hypothetical protein
MKQVKNRSGLAEIRRILRSVSSERDVGQRIAAISEQFLGCPYVVNSLGGGAGLPEALVVKLDSFDCVTYMETVLALALADSAEQVKEKVIRIRYHNGKVAWQNRNHYTSDWWRNNEKLGLLENLTRGEAAVEKVRELNVVNGLPARRVSFRVFPKKKFKSLEKRMKTGDFVCFGSTKTNLDVFHTGILIRRDDKILLRHASRTAKQVIDQAFQDFLKNNRMSGFVLLRPIKHDS